MIETKQRRFTRLDLFVATAAGALTLALLGLTLWTPPAAEAPGGVQFLGRLHPILVHLPIGFLFALLVLEVVDLFVRSAILHHATYLMAWLAGFAAVFAVVAGIILAYPGGYSEELLFRHRWLGVFTAICAIWLLAWKVSRSPSKPHGWSFAYHPLLAAAAALLLGAGHYGGSLTHGSDYLTDYMPAALRSLLGLAEKTPAPAAVALDDPADTVIFSGLIEPILRTNCVRCHGQEKQKGDLRLDSYAFLQAGGESGPDVSLIAESLHLPIEDEKHMPPKERPQLSLDEIALITWWVRSGASELARIRDVPAGEQIDRILQAKLGLSAEDETWPMKEWEEIEAVVQELRGELGVRIQRVSRDSPALEVPFVPSGAVFGDAELERLASLPENIESLNLSGSAVTDAGLAHLAGMKNLVRIDLSNTKITDAGLAHLGDLPRLHYLNLYGARITDEGASLLARIPSLRRVFLWQTGVTAEAASELARNLTDEFQVETWRTQIGELERRIDAAKVEIDLGYTLSPESSAAPVVGPVNERCPVSGKPVDSAHQVAHAETTIGFCCEKCVAKFHEDPDAVLAKLGLSGAGD